MIRKVWSNIDATFNVWGKLHYNLSIKLGRRSASGLWCILHSICEHLFQDLYTINLVAKMYFEHHQLNVWCTVRAVDSFEYVQNFAPLESHRSIK